MLIYAVLAVPAAAGAAAGIMPWRRWTSWLAACSAPTRSAPSWSW
jgi:hypothetical protein